jgi:EAL domain-containing protein (putative c-di-GMP-specific phosphodiesterase class I)
MVEEHVTSRSSERPGAGAERAPMSAAARAPAGWGAAFDAAVLAVVDDPGRHHFVHQPIVDLSRGVITGYEMLSRFSGADATPDQWFAAADRLGVGAALQVRVLRHGVAQLASLPPDTFLTINLDPRLIAHDVGAGYSGLQALLAVRPQIVKLDRSLVSGIDRDPARRALAEMLGEFVGRLDAWVLAEGIETLGELRAVIDLGVPLGQGYALGRPAAGFAPQFADEPRQVIANRAGARVFVETLAPLVETVPIASSVDDARATLRGDPALYHVVLVDGDESVRPVGLLSRAQAFEPCPVPSQPLCARMSEPADEVARRAMAREVDQRFDPVVCRDARGRYQGIVTIERLVERLTDGRARV